ncbi:MAG: hypothetical protein HY791_40195 [Deltaproteobacteria bacterium]|nr:hypothetical protein [Deltaproteobacteria bacterium]
MGALKIAISLPEELVAEVRGDARSSDTTVSAWIADAASRKLRRKYARDALAEFEAKHGSITESELEEARKRWPA